MSAMRSVGALVQMQMTRRPMQATMPITPLPWSATGLTVRGGARLDGNTAAQSFSTQDALYIAHAANAYPKLVEALSRIALMAEHGTTGRARTAAVIARDARAILSELDEQS